MKARHAAALALVGWCLFNSAVVWAQDKTFIAPDGSFSFRYWLDLVGCKPPKDNWPENCVSYRPVCDDLLQEEVQTSFACLGHPRDGFAPRLQAATFSVETLDNEKTEKGCVAARPLVRAETWAGWTAINGVRFAVFDNGDAGGMSFMVGRVYRTFHRGKCYQLGVNLAASSGDFDPPVPQLTEKDMNEINGPLEQARKSFRFLK